MIPQKKRKKKERSLPVLFLESLLLQVKLYIRIFWYKRKEVNKIDLSVDSITLRSTVLFASKCQTCGDRPINCKPRPYKYGDLHIGNHLRNILLILNFMIVAG